MNEKHEELFALWFAVVFPIVVGFVVAVRMYVDGVGWTSLFLLAVWIAATCFLWTLPRVLQRFGGKRKVVRDERNVLVYANSALVAHGITWILFIAAAALACWMAGNDGTVSVSVIPVAIICGAIVFQVVFVLCTYIQEKTRIWPVKN
jgi:hypothetical protein